MASNLTIQFGPFHLCPSKRLLLRDGASVSLTPKAFDTLLLLIERRDRVVSKQELLEELWPDIAVEEATLSQHVFMVRRALNSAADVDAEYIATIPRRGYRFVARVEIVEPAAGSEAGDVVDPGEGAVSGNRRVLKRTRVRTAAVLVAVAASASLVTWQARRPPAAPATIRLTFLLPHEQQLWRLGRGAVAVAPDGQSFVYAANRQLYLRRLSEREPQLIRGTDLDVSTPFLSPDGAWIGFWSAQDSTFKKIPVSGGSAITLGRASNPRGAYWFGDQIVFAEGSGVMALPSRGGTRDVWFGAGPNEMLHTPQVLPGGDNVLVTVATVVGNLTTRSDVAVYSRTTGARRILITGASSGRYSTTGQIIYAAGASLLAAPFDARRHLVTGRPTVIAEDVMRDPPHFDLSAEGTLVYVPDDASTAARRQLAVVDRHGNARALGGPAGSYTAPRVSPDAARIAITTEDDGGTIWIADTQRPASMRRLTFQGHARFPVWSPDGRRIAFSSTRDGAVGIFVQAADGTGTAERLTNAQPGFENEPASWSRDGAALAFVNVKLGIKDTIWIVALAGEHTAEQILAVPGSNQMDPSFSPDGRWLAYASEGEAGESRLQVYVEPLPRTGAKYQVTRDGGDMPAWSPDGRRLFYHDPNSRGVVSVQIQPRPSFSFGDPIEHFGGRVVSEHGYDVLSASSIVVPLQVDGRVEPRPHRQINVVLNWFRMNEAGGAAHPTTSGTTDSFVASTAGTRP
jgi:DNA-binding winged helix-turn-helix (wHTH) protein/Tol biopolymer transport system component